MMVSSAIPKSAFICRDSLLVGCAVLKRTLMKLVSSLFRSAISGNRWHSEESRYLLIGVLIASPKDMQHIAISGQAWWALKATNVNCFSVLVNAYVMGSTCI